MKKICICTTISLTMKTFVLETAKYLSEKEGYNITLICNDDEELKKILPYNIRFIPVPMARGIDLSAIKSIISLVKIFKKEQFDLVQYSTPNAAFYASTAARICNVPIRLYCQWGIRYVGLKGFSKKIFKIVEKIICKNSTIIRSVSKLNKKFAVSEGLYKSEKAVVIGAGGTIGVDMTKYDITKKNVWNKEIRQQYNIDFSEFVFGFVGRISVEKGCKELLTSFKHTLDNGIVAKLFIIGPIEKNSEIDSELFEWAKASPHILWTGFIDASTLNKYYSAIDVLIHPTYREGFGMVIQEAGALGIPTVTTKIPGASEVMEDGVSSIHIDAKNIEQLTKVMTELPNNSTKVKCLAENAFLRTKKLYARTIMLEHQRLDYVALLKEKGE